MRPTVLVTGANGFTGHYFAHYLGKRGVPTRAMYYPPDGRPDHDYECVDLVGADIRDREAVARSMEGIETVYHIAALYRPANIGEKPFWDVNVEGTRIMVEEAAKAGVKKFVNTSTIGVHGTVGREPIDEEGLIRPDDYYQLTKWEGEKLSLELAKGLGLPLTVIRPAGIYGPRERRFLKITQLTKRRRLVMFGSGETFYHFVHVEDLCEAYLLAAQSERSIGRSYIIADDHAISIRHMVQCIADACGVRGPRIRLPYWTLRVAAVLCEAVCKPFGIAPPMHRRRAAWFVSNRTFDISRARTELGYAPRVRIEDGLRQMVESFREAGWI